MKNKKIIYLILIIILIIISIFIFKYQDKKIEIKKENNKKDILINKENDKEIDKYVEKVIKEESNKILFKKEIDGNTIKMNSLGEVILLKNGIEKKIDDLNNNKIYNDVRIVDVFKYTTKENKVYYIEIIKYDDEYDFTILNNDFKNLIDLRWDNKVFDFLQKSKGRFKEDKIKYFFNELEKNGVDLIKK